MFVRERVRKSDLLCESAPPLYTPRNRVLREMSGGAHARFLLTSRGICVAFVMRKTTTNECSRFIKGTDRKVFFSGPGHQEKRKTNHFSFPLPTFLKLKVWRDHSRSIRVTPCTLPSFGWAAEENNQAPRCWSFSPSLKRKRRRKRRL